MVDGDDDPRVYQALMLPQQALDRGGVEILRAGIVDEELYVSAMPAFKEPAQWGEVLGEVAHRLGAIYAAHAPGLSAHDVTVQIAQAFAAEIGVKPVKTSAATTSATPRKAAASSTKNAGPQSARRAAAAPARAAKSQPRKR